MNTLQSLETRLNDIFVKQAPPLPPSGQRALVQYLPWVSLVLGLLSLATVYALWQWMHLAAGLINSAGSLSSTYSGPLLVHDHLTFGIWLGLIVLLIEAGLFLAAFPGTRARKKAGWNLLLAALLTNVVYGVVILCTAYGGFGALLGALISSGIGLYLLFQIRASYGTPRPAARKAARPARPKTAAEAKKAHSSS